MLSGRGIRASNPLWILSYKLFTVPKKVVSLRSVCQCNNTQSRLISITPRNYRYNYPLNKKLFSIHTSTQLSVEGQSKPPEEILEKLIAGLSSDIHQKHRVYKNDFLKVLNKVKELNFSSKKQGLLLLRCCADLLPDEGPATKMILVEQVWNTLKPHTDFEVEHYNELLRVYIANGRTLTVSSFMNQMAPVKPTILTYELILRALAEEFYKIIYAMSFLQLRQINNSSQAKIYQGVYATAGDLNQTTEVISNMKAQGLPATEDIFNSLIICQGKVGNIQSIQEVLTMMKSLKLEYTADTYTALAQAFAWNKLGNKVIENLGLADKQGIQFTERNIMDVVKICTKTGLHEVIPSVLKYLPQEILKTPSISPYMQSVTTYLVFQNQAMAALEIYKCLPLPSFGPNDDTGLHGRSFVRDCVKASIPSSLIGLITQELMSSGRNPIALQNASEAALQLGKVPLALDLFTRMTQIGLPIRPHYFWPIFIQSSKSYGEKGIMNTLINMADMDVKPDYETLMNYVLPFVSFTSPQNLMKKLLDVGLTVTTVLTPMMEVLLNSGQVRGASEICELFQGKVDVEKLLKPLLKGYLTSADTISTVHILEDVTEKAVDKKKDWIGRFLSVFMQHKKVTEDMSDFVNLLKALKEKKLCISTSAADFCIQAFPQKHGESWLEIHRQLLVDITDEQLVDEGEVFSQNFTQHPKQMSEESLRAHLNELEAKGMNTRGVLRKLLQEYIRKGNLAAAREIVLKCQKEEVFLSAGMKAAIFDLHVKSGELELAEVALSDLNKSSPNFTLDEYKVIDFATLMVYRKQIDTALQFVTDESKKRRIVGGRSISMNCWRLLDATAARGGPGDARAMFHALVSARYCQPDNNMLGPLIRVHLKDGKIAEAVEEFSRLVHKYNKTPLKHELLCKILISMGDGHSEEDFLTNAQNNSSKNKLAQNVLNLVKKAHGQSDLQLTLIAALADVGYTKSLRKLFLDPKMRLHPDALMRRCERFAHEKKVNVLQAIAESARDLRQFNINDIYELIIDVYQREDNSRGALKLWTAMMENDVVPTEKLIKKLCSILKANNAIVPSDLAMHYDKYFNEDLKKADVKKAN